MLFQVTVIHICSFFEVTVGVLILHLIQNMPWSCSGPRRIRSVLINMKAKDLEESCLLGRGSNGGEGGSVTPIQGNS